MLRTRYHFWPLWLRLGLYRIVGFLTLRERRETKKIERCLAAWFEHVTECEGC